MSISSSSSECSNSDSGVNPKSTVPDPRGLSGSKCSGEKGLLRRQLDLEFKLQDTCQQLLHYYKESHSWTSSSQIAQSLITGSHRIAHLKQEIASGGSLTPPTSPLDHINGSEDPQGVNNGLPTLPTVQEEEPEIEGVDSTLVEPEVPQNSEPVTTSSIEEGVVVCSNGVSGLADSGDPSGDSGDSDSDCLEARVKMNGDTTHSELDSVARDAEGGNCSTLHPLEDSGNLGEGLPLKGETRGEKDESQIGLLDSIVQDLSLQPALCEFLSGTKSPSNADLGGKESQTKKGEMAQEVPPVAVNGEDLTATGSGGTSPEASLQITSTNTMPQGTQTSEISSFPVPIITNGHSATQEEVGGSPTAAGSMTSSQELTSEEANEVSHKISRSESNPEFVVGEGGATADVPRRESQLDSVHLGLLPSSYPLKTASSENIESSESTVSGKTKLKWKGSLPSVVKTGTRRSVDALRTFSMKRFTGKRKASAPERLTNTVQLLKTLPMQEWDPTCLLEELYSDYRRVAPMGNPSGETARYYGYLDKLPMNQSKATLAKGWKRRYFRAMEGNLYYYETRTAEKPLGLAHLTDSKIICNPAKLNLKVVEKKGKSLMMKAPDSAELTQWHRALQLEAAHPTMTCPLSPVLQPENPIVIIDIGSCSLRAGFAGEKAYPQVFTPAVCSIDAATLDPIVCGLDALLPHNRYGANLVYPRKPSMRMNRSNNRDTNLKALYSIIRSVLYTLNVEPQNCQVLLTLPSITREEDQDHELAEILLQSIGFSGIFLQEQAILALYSYNTTSGVVVDIGDHVDVIPVIDGYTIEAGISRLPFGGNAITENLSKLITAKGIRYFSETEAFINRFLKESLCFLSQDFAEDTAKCDACPADYTQAIDLDRFQLTDHRKVIALDDSLFKAPEGLFNPHLWGKDVPGIHELVWKAIQACPIDQRKEMSRKIFLSGGSSLLPGFKERLQKELSVLAPQGITIEVHASDTRQHAAYLGASVLASLSSFQRSVVTQEEWDSLGVDAFKKWSTP